VENSQHSANLYTFFLNFDYLLLHYFIFINIAVYIGNNKNGIIDTDFPSLLRCPPPHYNFYHRVFNCRHPHCRVCMGFPLENVLFFQSIHFSHHLTINTDSLKKPIDLQANRCITGPLVDQK